MEQSVAELTSARAGWGWRAAIFAGVVEERAAPVQRHWRLAQHACDDTRRPFAQAPCLKFGSVVISTKRLPKVASMSCYRLARTEVLPTEATSSGEGERLKLDRYDAEGVALIRRKMAAIQGMRVRIWRLGRIPRSRRNSLYAEEVSLAWFQLAQLRFALATLANHLRKFREGRPR